MMREIERRPVQAASAISGARAIRAESALVFWAFRGAAWLGGAWAHGRSAGR